MFELTRDEIAGVSQFVTSSSLKFSKRVTVFTEQGVAMLSSVLRSKRAIAVNVEIMRTFVKLRHILTSNAELARRLGELCLLYTSPSPRDRQKSRMPSSA